jgi:serine/threonine protein kinase
MPGASDSKRALDRERDQITHEVGVTPESDPFKRRYELRGQLWSGLWISGWLALDRSLDRQVVVNIADIPAHNDRLLPTARCRASLRHANLIPVYDVGLTGDGRQYYTEPYVKVRGLDQLLCDPEPGGPAVTFVRLLNILLDVCKAVAFLHANGLLHLLLHPGDVLVSQRLDEVFVVRGNSACPPGVSAKELDATLKPGRSLTCPGYTAPEQVNPPRSGKPGISSDVYGLGGILYETLYGHPPNMEDSRSVREIFASIINRKGPPEPRAFHERAAHYPKLARRLQPVCLKALEFNPAKRHPNVEAFVEAIERVAWEPTE